MSRGAISFNLVVHVQYELHSSNIAIVGITAVAELLTIQADSDKEAAESNQLQ